MAAFEPWRHNFLESSLAVPGRRTLSIFYLNLTNAGVIGALKLEMLSEFVTQRLHADPDSSMAIILQTNRAGDDVVLKREDGDDDDDAEVDVPDGKSRNSMGAAGSAGSGCARVGSTNSVRQSKRRILEAFSDDAKKLIIQDAVVVFAADSVYGARSETHELILITAASGSNSNSRNAFHAGRLWRRNVVAGVQMIPKSAMIRPHVVKDNIIPSDTPLTIVQIHKQAA